MKVSNEFLQCPKAKYVDMEKQKYPTLIEMEPVCQRGEKRVIGTTNKINAS